jgi:hypothetical protein
MIDNETDRPFAVGPSFLQELETVAYAGLVRNCNEIISQSSGGFEGMNEPKASPRSVEVVFAVASSVETASLPSGDELQIKGYLQQTFGSVAIRTRGG